MRIFSATLLITLMAVAALADEPCPPRWSYEGDTGPDRWGSLDPAWSVCTTGLLQSPIDTTQYEGLQDNTLPRISAPYPVQSLLVNNTSRAVKVYPTNTTELIRGGTRFKLQEFHFHVPVEHKTNTSGGAKAELHLVHHTADGKQTVVLAVFIMEGSTPNAALEKILAKVPQACGRAGQADDVDLTQLLPISRPGGDLNRYFTYIGSLTTPACTEGLIWIILNDGITATADQIARLKIVPDNARKPVKQRVRWRSAG